MFRCLVALSLMMALLLPAKAASVEIYGCRDVFNVEGKLVSGVAPSKVEVCAEAQHSALSNLRHALALAWKVAQNPAEILGLVKLEALRSHERIGVSSGSLYHFVARTLRPDVNHWNEDAFPELRARFADSANLRGFWDSTKGTAVRLMKAAAITGYVEQTYTDVKILFERPFDVSLASASPRWYDYQCWRPKQEDRRSSDAAQVCKELSWFADRFKQVYGAEPTYNSSWTLGFLFRRHMEGGMKLVVEYQNIAKEFGKMLETKG